MTVPAAGGGAAGPRKPLYRCIPEIHVTRLSVSSSLRPKVGLLLLAIVLLATLCLLGVPLVTKVLVPLVVSRQHHPIVLPPGQTFSQQLLTAATSSTSESLVLSPVLVRTVLAPLARWSEGATRDQLERLLGPACDNCSRLASVSQDLVSLSGVVLVPGQQVKEGVVTREPEVERLDYRVAEARHQVEEWLRQHGEAGGLSWVVDSLDNSQVVGLGVARVALRLGEVVEGEPGKLRVEGEMMVGKLGHRTVVVLEGLGEGLSLCLVQPPGEGGECASSLLTRQRVVLTLPALSLTSRLPLAPVLATLGATSLLDSTAQLGPLSSQKSLRLGQLYLETSLSVRGRGGTRKARSLQTPSEIAVEHLFSVLVEQRSYNRTILIGTFSAPELH